MKYLPSLPARLSNKCIKSSGILWGRKFGPANVAMNINQCRVALQILGAEWTSLYSPLISGPEFKKTTLSRYKSRILHKHSKQRKVLKKSRVILPFPRSLPPHSSPLQPSPVPSSRRSLALFLLPEEEMKIQPLFWDQVREANDLFCGNWKVNPRFKRMNLNNFLTK